MYTTQTPTTRDHMARVMAGGRITDARRAERARRTSYATDLLDTLDTLLAEGAARIGVKVCGDDGKYRYMLDDLDRDRDFILLSLASTYGEDAEVWGVRADGSYCESVC